MVEVMIESLFKLSDSIRYVAVYKNGQLESKSKSNILDASSSESDRYEELLVKVILRHAHLSTTQRYLGKVTDLEAIRWIENLYA